MCVCVSKRRPQYALTPSIPTGSLDILCVCVALREGKKKSEKRANWQKKNEKNVKFECDSETLHDLWFIKPFMLYLSNTHIHICVRLEPNLAISVWGKFNTNRVNSKETRLREIVLTRLTNLAAKNVIFAKKSLTHGWLVILTYSFVYILVQKQG